MLLFSFVPVVLFIIFYLARFAFHGWLFSASAFVCSLSLWSFFQFLIIFSYNSYLAKTKTNPNPHSSNEQSPSKCFNITGPFISSSALVRFVFYRLLELFSVVAFILHAVLFFCIYTETPNIYCLRLSILYCALTAASCATSSSLHYTEYMRTLNANLCMCKLFPRQKHSTHTITLTK